MIFKAFDVVVVPFPFTDRDAAKRRPAMVIPNALCPELSCAAQMLLRVH